MAQNQTDNPGFMPQKISGHTKIRAYL